MSKRDGSAGRIDPAVHATRVLVRDPAEECDLSRRLKSKKAPKELLVQYSRHAFVDGPRSAIMRRVLLRALCKSFGHGVRIGIGVLVAHPETFEIGDGVFIGNQAFLQGRHEGRLVIGERCWIGPQSYFDARDAVLEDGVGWGPGAKLLGGEHTGVPLEEPIIATPVRTRPVRVGRGADIGVNAVLLPGVTVGEGAIVGAGAVVTKDVAPYDVVAGVPARVLRSRRSSRKSALKRKG